MKTAILISGHMRSFERCLPTLHWFVFRHFPGADFFVSTEPDADAPKAELLRQKYPGARVEIDLTPQPRIDTSTFAGASDHAPYAISVSQEAVLGQLWRLQRCWDFFETATRQDARTYDLFIRCRPDLWMESFTLPKLTQDLFIINSDWQHLRTEQSFGGTGEIARTPWWGRFGGVNDRFAIFCRAPAYHYFTTWSKIHALLAAGCPLHPESLIKASIEEGGCTIDDTLDVSFSTLRANGERRFPEITAQDIAHMRA